MKRAFVGFIHGTKSEPVSDGEMVVYSDGESSTGETESLYQLQDGRFGGCSDGDSIPDPLEPPNRVAIFNCSSDDFWIGSRGRRPRAPAGSSSVWFVGRLDDVIGHNSYPGDSRSA